MISQDCKAFPDHFNCDVIVAGHICLDIFPDLSQVTVGDVLGTAGALHQIGPAVLSTGGAVANTGLAIRRLGARTKLMGKIGDDPFGRLLGSLLTAIDPALADGMIVGDDATTSYSVVISTPSTDRIFLHHCGANDTYCSADVTLPALQGARLFHFGYPPIMRRMYIDSGDDLTNLFAKVKSQGLTTSLDMCHVDRQSGAARVDWRALLKSVLPYVDIFLPSLDEICFMLGRPLESTAVDVALLDAVASELLEMGAAIVVLKLGDQGLYLRTTARPERFSTFGYASPTDSTVWCNRQILAPCFCVDVRGTTGAGDCTIAGFLAAALRDLPPAAVLNTATGTGACCVEQPDAVSGVPDWQTLQDRLSSGWAKRATLPLPSGWIREETTQLWIGPHDASHGTKLMASKLISETQPQ